MNKAKLLDKYIMKQLLETFLLGVIIFTSIIFASDTFLYLIKEITSYGVPFTIALRIIILRLPQILALTIPMGVLLSVILTFNKLSVNSETTIMRACGISISRLSLPVLVFGILAALLNFSISEYIVPAANLQAKNLTLWALTQRNIPDGKTNFSFKELDKDGRLRRLFYIDNYTNKKLQGITVLDMSREGTVQIIQSKYGNTNAEAWNFNQGVAYTISQSGKALSTTAFDKLKIFTNFSYGKALKNKGSELNFADLMKHIEDRKKQGDVNLSKLVIQLHEKFAIPITSLLIALIGVPLAMTPPRSRFNRGFLFSLTLIFLYYVARAFCISLGEAQIIDPALSAWLPNLIILTAGSVLFYRKAYLL